MKLQLVSAVLTDNGNGITVAASGEDMLIIPKGTFGGGTLTLKVSADNGSTFVALNPSVTWTSAVGVSVSLPKGTIFRVELTGATTPSLDVYAFL